MPTRYYKQFLPNVFDHITFTVFSPMGHCDRHVSGKKKKNFKWFKQFCTHINNDGVHLPFHTFPKYFHRYNNNCRSPQSMGNSRKLISIAMLQIIKQKPWRVLLFSHHTMWHLGLRKLILNSIFSKHPLIEEIHGCLATQSLCSFVPAPIYLLQP